jgi:hypothetical protein
MQARLFLKMDRNQAVPLARRMWRRVLARGLPQAAAFGAAAYASAGLVRATGPEAAAPSPVRGLRNADVLLMADAQLERPRRRFEGKTILITGAGGSFGREGARYFASEGANIIAADMGEAALGDTRRAALEAEPSARVLTAVCDIRDRASVHALVEAGIAAFGSIDLCWNNAGLQGLMKPTLEYPADDFQMVRASAQNNTRARVHAFFHVARNTPRAIVCWIASAFASLGRAPDPPPPRRR